MGVNFPCYVKTQDVLNLEQLVFEIKEGSFIEAVLPNGTLYNRGGYLEFDGGKDETRAVIPAQMTKDRLVKWIEDLLPVETEEEREDRLRWEQDRLKWEQDRLRWEQDRLRWEQDRLRWEQENELRAAGLEEPC